MHYLIDAYNLLFRILKKRGSLEKNRHQLIQEIDKIASLLNLNLTLVFDGAEEHPSYATRSHFNTIELIYTPKNTTADHYISDHVANSKKSSQITVVTNDRELALRCKSHGAKVETIDGFIAFLSKKKTKKTRFHSLPERQIKGFSSELNRLLIIFEKKMLEKDDS